MLFCSTVRTRSLSLRLTSTRTDSICISPSEQGTEQQLIRSCWTFKKDLFCGKGTECRGPRGGSSGRFGILVIFLVPGSLSSPFTLDTTLNQCRAWGTLAAVVHTYLQINTKLIISTSIIRIISDMQTLRPTPSSSEDSHL